MNKVTLIDKQCEYCGKVYQPKRTTSKFCSTNCKVNASRGKAPKEAEEEVKELPKHLGLPPLKEVDRTRAFTNEEMELVRKLPRELWLAYMERPNAVETMTMQERIKHYRSGNYPDADARYVNAGEASRAWGAH